MSVFDPNDFADQPYVGGLNQMGHVTFGAALIGIASLMFPLWASVLVSGGGVLAWEAYQLRRKGAKITDYIADLIYWMVGIAMWSALIGGKMITGAAILAPMVPLVAWMVEYLRIKQRAADL